MVSTLTNTKGEFELEGRARRQGRPVVIQVGKWRRKLDVRRHEEVRREQGPRSRVPPSEERHRRRHAAHRGHRRRLRRARVPPPRHRHRRQGVRPRREHRGSRPRLQRRRRQLPGAPNAGGTRRTRSAASSGTTRPRCRRYDMVMLSCECSENNENKGGDVRRDARRAPGDVGLRQHGRQDLRDALPLHVVQELAAGRLAERRELERERRRLRRVRRRPDVPEGRVVRRLARQRERVVDQGHDSAHRRDRTRSPTSTLRRRAGSRRATTRSATSRSTLRRRRRPRISAVARSTPTSTSWASAPAARRSRTAARHPADSPRSRRRSSSCSSTSRAAFSRTTLRPSPRTNESGLGRDLLESEAGFGRPRCFARSRRRRRPSRARTRAPRPA